MIDVTSAMDELRPEFPFLLHDGDKLIDGTIDLLCRSADGFAIFDYKFTEAAENEVLEQYRGQMDIYRKAAGRCFPDAGSARTELIVVSSRDVKRLRLDF